MNRNLNCTLLNVAKRSSQHAYVWLCMFVYAQNALILSIEIYCDSYWFVFSSFLLYFIHCCQEYCCFRSRLPSITNWSFSKRDAQLFFFSSYNLPITEEGNYFKFNHLLCVLCGVIGWGRYDNIFYMVWFRWNSACQRTFILIVYLW